MQLMFGATNTSYNILGGSLQLLLDREIIRRLNDAIDSAKQEALYNTAQSRSAFGCTKECVFLYSSGPGYVVVWRPYTDISLIVLQGRLRHTLWHNSLLVGH